MATFTDSGYSYSTDEPGSMPGFLLPVFVRFGQFPAVQCIGKYPSNSQIEKAAKYSKQPFEPFE
jgi:hypothetical protein